MDDDKKKVERPLTNKEKLFIECYLTCWNASEAARKAGYKPKNANVIGPRMLAKVGIARAIKTRLSEAAMGADEVLKRLADQARVDSSALFAKDGKLDLAGAKKLGVLKHVRRIKQQGGEHPSVDIELVDVQGALALLAKGHKLLTDKTELSGADGKPVQQKIVIEYVNDWRNKSENSTS